MDNSAVGKKGGICLRAEAKALARHCGETIKRLIFESVRTKEEGQLPHLVNSKGCVGLAGGCTRSPCIHFPLD